MISNNYIIKTERTILRKWTTEDLLEYYKICSDKDVMKYFPRENTLEECQLFISRMQNQFIERGHCYFALELIDSKEFLGFVGLSHQEYEANFTPCVDIGWRINKKHWQNGYATEAAKACLDYAFNKLQLQSIYSIAPKINNASIAVMKKLNMIFEYDFIHPYMDADSYLNPCSVYKIDKSEYKNLHEAR